MSAVRKLAPETRPRPVQRELSSEITSIIDKGRQAQFSAGSVKPVLAASSVTALLLWMAFTPLDFGPLAWVSLVPMCLLLRIQQLPKRSYLAIYTAGFVWSLFTLQWMRLGHPVMYLGLFSLSIYTAFYFVGFVALGRKLVAAKTPLWLAVPLAWTALEYLRAHLLTGFSWYYLGHTQYQWTTLVQISDLTGAYGVSFLVAFGNAVLASCVSDGWMVKFRLAAETRDVQSETPGRLRMGIATCACLTILACGYGFLRLQPIDQTKQGPVIAVAQGNFPPEMKADRSRFQRMVYEHDLLSRRAAGLQPDLIVWPETMFPVPIREADADVSDGDLVAELEMLGSASNKSLAQAEIKSWRDDYAKSLLVNRTQESGAALMIGLTTEHASKEKRQRFNSAAFLRPDIGYVGKYDKIHRVVFGEYIPMRSVVPQLAALTPFGAGFGIDAGTEHQVFEYSGTHYAPVICFEDTVPHLVRNAIRATKDGQQPDVIINLTNDAWFRASSELDQHMITATFRCIENRRPMVRAVNGGISTYIDGCGRVRMPEHFEIRYSEKDNAQKPWTSVESMIDPSTGQRYRDCAAMLCGQVPLDGRWSLYTAFGDWFAMICSLSIVVGLIKLRFTGTSA